MNALLPCATFAELFPPDAVFAPRSTSERIRWVCDEPFRVDTVTGYTMAVMGAMPLICHRAAATPAALEFFCRAGLRPPDHVETYDTEDEFVAVAKAHLRHARRLAYAYPLPPAFDDEETGLLIPLSLYNWLNDKLNLVELVDPACRPDFRSFPVAALPGLVDVLPGRPVYVKACHPGASGSGSDVRFCPDPATRIEAAEWLAARSAGLSGILVEEAVAVHTCWCLNLAVLDDGVRYLGAATQLFEAPGSQSGSRIDPDDQPSRELVELTLAIAERARLLGYRGVAGFDIGITEEGRPYVFDLNFRIASSTPLVLLHEPACRRVGARISQSWGGMANGPLGPALEQVAGFADRGRFVPFRLYEATEATGGKCMVTGMVVADSVAEADVLAAEMDAALARAG